jgi:photosystem II stability/assembly factor-like uncharacterized protein
MAMLKPLTTLVAAACLSASNAQWTQITSPYSGNMWCIKFFNANVGYIGTNTVLMRTDDGGNTWTNIPTSVALINGLAFPSATVGYYGANNNVVAKTTDQGANWTQQNPNISPFGITSLSFVDVNTGYAVGSGGVARKTTNGGVTWSTINPSVGLSDLQEVHFFNAQEGVCIAHDGKIRRTANGGTSWSLVTSGTTANLNDMHFVDPSIGYIVGGSGTILKTTNGGLSWTAQNSGITTALSSVCFKNALEGIAGGSGGLILRTSNGGATWVQEQIGIFLGTMKINDIVYHNGRYIAVGDQGRMATDQTNVGLAEDPDQGPMLSLYPNPASDVVTVEVGEELPTDAGFQLVNSLGEVVLSGPFRGRMERIDIGHLSAGQYLVEVRSATARVRRKLLIQR